MPFQQHNQCKPSTMANTWPILDLTSRHQTPPEPTFHHFQYKTTRNQHYTKHHTPAEQIMQTFHHCQRPSKKAPFANKLGAPLPPWEPLPPLLKRHILKFLDALASLRTIMQVCKRIGYFTSLRAFCFGFIFHKHLPPRPPPLPPPPCPPLSCMRCWFCLKSR